MCVTTLKHKIVIPWKCNRCTFRETDFGRHMQTRVMPAEPIPSNREDSEMKRTCKPGRGALAVRIFRLYVFTRDLENTGLENRRYIVELILTNLF